jgi:uncharacterized protein
LAPTIASILVGPNKDDNPMTVPENEIHYVEIVTPDIETTRDHYARAHGWEFEEMVPELGNAFVAQLPSGVLCGIRAPMHEQELPTLRTYIRVADLSASVATAQAQGATVLLPDMEIRGRGRIAIFLIGGIEQGIWQVP